MGRERRRGRDGEGEKMERRRRVKEKRQRNNEILDVNVVLQIKIKGFCMLNSLFKVSVV